MGFLDLLKGKKNASATATRQAGAAEDPVCHMHVDPATAKGGQSQHGNHTYWFCSPGCKAKFDQDPHAYLGAHAH